MISASVLEITSPLLFTNEAVTFTGWVSSGVNAHSLPPDLSDILSGVLPVVGLTDHSTEPFEGMPELSTARMTCSPTCGSPAAIILGAAAKDAVPRDKSMTADRNTFENFMRIKKISPFMMKISVSVRAVIIP